MAVRTFTFVDCTQMLVVFQSVVDFYCFFIIFLKIFEHEKNIIHFILKIILNADNRKFLTPQYLIRLSSWKIGNLLLVR